MIKKIIYILVFVCIVLLILYGIYVLSSSRTFQFYGDIIHRVETSHKVVALTFDDGPSPKSDSVLAILKKHNVHATFFLTGNSMHHYFDETQRIVAAGHEIGNHSYSHVRLICKRYTTIAREIETTDSLIRQAGYRKEIHVRPPHAKKLLLLPYYLEQHNRKTILWDIEPESYDEIASNSDAIAQHVVERTRNGSIILLHPMYNWDNESVDAIEKIILELHKKGYTFVTISELLKYRNK